ncbi:MAG: extracellular solute-binding protein [Pseudomonadota bacterium]
MNSIVRKLHQALLGVGLAALTGAAGADELLGGHAISEFGTPKYADSMTHWPYVNPNAPKGGRVVLGAFGTYDSLNMYLLKGNWPRSIGLTMDTLMVASSDELLSVYGLIAERAEYPPDKSWIEFTLRPEARYADGAPIVAGDFALAFDTIRKHGRPFLRSFYRDVDAVEVISDHKLKFTFKTRGNMKPLMQVATMAPMPAHYWKTRDITKTTLDPWPSSGAYELTKVEPGRTLTYTRVKDYWGADLPVNRGRFNFDQIRYDYYRDLGVLFEAFKAGEVDYRIENSSKRWATGYDIPAVKEARIIIETLPDRSPSGIQALIMNSRRAKFRDVRAREAYGLLMDFEWMRKKLLYNQYTRTSSYFPNSDYGATDKPSAPELAVLEPYRDQLPKAVLEEAFRPPKTDGTGRNRKQVRQALKLFKDAGYTVVEGKLIGPDGKQVSIEILLVQPGFERLIAPYQQNLERIGIDASIRIVDSSQYERRTEELDFDMVNVRFNFFPPPGAELRSFYGSAAADQKGAGNMMGIKDPVVDALIEKIIAAPDLDTLKVHTRALDRVLLWQHYLIPEWHNDTYRLAYWDKFARPEQLPKYGTGFPHNWWRAPGD